jgi:hypothetical protein
MARYGFPLHCRHKIFVQRDPSIAGGLEIDEVWKILDGALFL